MKKFWSNLAVAMLSVFVVLSVSISAVAQTPAANDAPYQLSFYTNRNNTALADQSIDIVNDGNNGSPTSANEGAICVNIYVFDSVQEMVECCSCPLTGNGHLSLSLVNNLTQNPITGFPAPDSGVIKLVATNTGPRCDPTNDLSGKATQTGMLAWKTQIVEPITGLFIPTTSEFLRGTLSNREAQFLPQACAFVRFGTGKGNCTCSQTPS